jgi:prevent-host-death family protein
MPDARLPPSRVPTVAGLTSTRHQHMAFSICPAIRGGVDAMRRRSGTGLPQPPQFRHHGDHGGHHAVDRVGIRQLRDRLTTYLRRVREGESLLIVDRGTPIARLAPAAPGLEAVADLAAEGLVEWGGGKPRGAVQPPVVRGGPISELVVEGRR